MLETLPAYREAFARANSQFDLVVLSSLALGAASVSEAVGIPRLTLHMQPALFRSTYDCPVFLEELSWLARSPRWAKRVFFKIVDRLLWETPRKTVNRFRSGLNLAPIRDFYLEGFHGAEGVAALFRAGSLLRNPTGRRRSGNSVFLSSTPLQGGYPSLSRPSSRPATSRFRPISIFAVFKGGRWQSRGNSICGACWSALRPLREGAPKGLFT